VRAGTLSHRYKVLFSFEVLGNPRGLFSKMATGVTDAFYEPLNGMMLGPEEFVSGILRGGKSLGDNVVLGVSDSVSKISGALAKGMAELSMDGDYLAKRSAAATALAAQTEAPRSVGEGLGAAVDNVAGGIARGVTGVFSKPIQGAQKGRPRSRST
jgi:vacuolar protein sorting-associated protein 13A/C